MSAYEVAIPSLNRVGRVTALDVFPEGVARLWVPDWQADDYVKEYGAARVVAVPAARDGSIAKAFNYVFDEIAAANVRHLLRVNDDVYGLGVWEGAQDRKLSVDEVDRFVRQGFEMAEGVGTVLWGINVIRDKRAYSVHRPLKLLAPVLGTFSGHIMPCGLRYDERLPLAEDYDYHLQVINGYRRSLRFDKYHCMTNDEAHGGCYSYRTMEGERECKEILVKKWGSRVVKLEGRNILDPKIDVPLAGC